MANEGVHAHLRRPRSETEDVIAAPVKVGGCHFGPQAASAVGGPSSDTVTEVLPVTAPAATTAAGAQACGHAMSRQKEALFKRPINNAIALSRVHSCISMHGSKGGYPTKVRPWLSRLSLL